MTRLLYVWLLSSCLWTHLAFAQSVGSVQGHIRAGGQPASFAPIALLSASDSSVVKGALADEQGAFGLNMPGPGTYRLHITYLGYQPYYSPVLTFPTESGLVQLDSISLLSAAHSLQAVTVTTQRSMVVQQADRTVLNVEGSVITKGNKVKDLLQYVPRVRLASDGSINVGNKTNVLVLVDGRMLETNALAAFLQNYSAEDLLSIEVIPNPSAQYDASYGAVLRITTRKSREEGLNGRGTLKYSQGTYGRTEPDVSLNYSRGRWHAYTSLSPYLHSGYYAQERLERFFPEGSLANQSSTLNTYNALFTNSSLDYSFNPRHVVGLRVNTRWDGLDLYDTKTRTTFASRTGPLDSLLNTHNADHELRTIYDLNLNYSGHFDTTGKALLLNLTQTLYRRQSQQDITYQYTALSERPLSPPTDIRITNPNDQRGLIAQADYSTPLGHKWGKLEVGGKYVHLLNNNRLEQATRTGGQYVVDSAFGSQGRYRERTLAAYVNLSKPLPGGWSIQTGLRLENTRQELATDGLQRTYGGLFPSLNVSRSLSRNRSYSFTYSRKIIRPALYNLIPYRYLTDRYTYSEGNPLLRPQFASTLEANYVPGKVSLFANYTWNKDQITQGIQTDPLTHVYTVTNINLERVDEYSFGLTVPLNPTRYWQTNTTLMGLGNATHTDLFELTGFGSRGFYASLFSSNIFTLPKGYRLELTLSYKTASRWAYWQMRSIYWASLSVNKALFADRSGNLRLSLYDVFRTQTYRISTQYGLINYTNQNYNDNQRVEVAFSFAFGRKTVKDARSGSLGNETEKNRMSGR